MSEPVRIVPKSGGSAAALVRRQRAKNWALAIILFALVGVFYLITVVRMGGHH